MSEEHEQSLIMVLQRLEKAYEEILKSQGYTRDTEKLKMLVEMTREQVSHENTRPSAG